jgi:hypothetical protein
MKHDMEGNVMKLKLVSIDEQNVFFDAIYPELIAIADRLPWPAHDPALQKLQSDEGRAEVVRISNIGLEAVEKHRGTS